MHMWIDRIARNSHAYDTHEYGADNDLMCCNCLNGFSKLFLRFTVLFFRLFLQVLGSVECAFQFLRCVSRYITSNTIIISHCWAWLKTAKKKCWGTQYYNSVRYRLLCRTRRILHIWLAYEIAIIEIYTHEIRLENNSNNFISYLFLYALSTCYCTFIQFYELFYDYIDDWLNRFKQVD